jgi:hypothetical protein
VKDAWQYYMDDFLRGYEAATGSMSNTFRRRPEPRPGFIDARRDDGCVPLITSLEATA